MKNTIGRLWVGLTIVAALSGCTSKPDMPDPGQGIVAPDPTKQSADAGHTPGNVMVASATPNVSAEGTTAAKPAPWGDATVATANKAKPISISMSELAQPLIEAHGLDMLLNVAQRALAKQGADVAGIAVTAEDFKAERERTLGLLFKELDATKQDKIDNAEKNKRPDEVKKLLDEREIERQQLLKQFYEQKHLTPTDFEILMETNAYLRKLAEPVIKDQITEAMLRTQFAARFGEQVRVRHMELKRAQDVVDVQRKLAAGEKFEDVARELSTNRDAALGGELLPFNREAPFPKVFIDVAFGLKVGQVSELVEAGGTYQLIKLEERIMPKAVVYEQQRDILYHDVHEQMLEGVAIQMRRQIMAVIQTTLKINDPAMSKQFQERLDEVNAVAKGKEAAKQEMDRERERLLQLEQTARQRDATQEATTQPGTAPKATQPVTAPARPPTSRAVVPISPAPRTRPSASPATAPAAMRSVPRVAPVTAPAALKATASATRPV